jgi:ElaB/YqjD/DUF883 family membrane-anchored ribosome-binding protein
MAKGDSGHPRMSAGYPGAEQVEGVKEKAREMASNVGETAGQVHDKARETAGQVRDKAREFASGAAEQAREAWHSASEGVQERISSLGHRAEDIWGDAADFIRRYPIASLAVAFGVGCMASCALMFLAQSSTDDVTERMSRASS